MNNKSKKTLFTLALFFGILLYSCSDSFLNQPAKGSVSTAQLNTQAGIEQVLIGAYATLSGSAVGQSYVGPWGPEWTNWVYGSVVGGESFKGSNSGDQSDINGLTSFTPTATNNYLKAQWVNCYDGINRANTVIKLLAVVPAGAISDANKARILGEARFLRGLFHFEAKIMWNMVPFIDETIDYTLNNYKVANTADIWPNIIADFDYAFTNLAASGMSAGRANKWAAAVYKAKCYMYQKNFAGALPLLTTIITQGVTPSGTPYGLNAKFRDAFDAKNDNSKESVFAIQASVNDGSGAAHANPETVLNYAYLSSLPVNCCGFNQPSLDLANSFRTNAVGLPLLDGSYNNDPNTDGKGALADEQWLASTTPASITPDAGNLDPRIDWTLGRSGVPYFDWGTYSGPPWVRSLSDGGPYTTKKLTFPNEEVGTYTDGSSWTAGYSAVNYDLVRFADVLLWAAEAEVEAGSLTNAMNYVNQLRARVQNPATWVKISLDITKSDWQAYKDPTIASKNAGNYVIGLYTIVDGTFGTKGLARQAVHLERQLELGMEGHRFFDLVRWGETVIANANGNPVNLQATINHNGKYVNLAKGVTFKAGKSEYYPIPQSQIDLMTVNGVSVLNQNPGY